jgi:chromosome partitioning protein
MTITIAVANASGSAGKTTSAVTLATLLAEAGRQVALVDADPQANATYWLGLGGHLGPTLTELVLRQASLDEVLTDTSVDNLRVIPAARSLDAVPIHLNAVVGRELRLRKMLTGIAADVVIIDCPGTISLLTISALVAANAVLTVTQPTMKEARGIPEMLDTIEGVQDAFNPSLIFAGIIPCIVPAANQGNLYKDVMLLLEATYPRQISPAVRRSSVVATAYGRGVPLPAWAPRDQVTADYRDVLGWLESRGVL